MNQFLKRAFAIIFIFFAIKAASASNLDTIGVTLLRETTTNLNGVGIRVAQPEAGFSQSQQYTNWEVNPAVVGQPMDLFTYISADGSTNHFPNVLSSESGHADSVGGIFYGLPNGVATNVAHVDNFDADFFYDSIISAASQNINDTVVNQSFTFGPQATNDQEAVDSAYDNYSVQYKTLFISAANNFGTSPPNSTRVCAPGTSYNCISVGAYANSTYQNSIGPTIDNGRCKPDITAPGDETSFSTPLVSGAAAILMQAALRGDGGADANSAADFRTVKALLLNGAIKPADWTNSNSSPLDFRYGAGVLNIFNSHEQLVGGKNNFISSTTVSSGGAHPPNGNAGTISALNGWDFNSISSSAGGLFTSATDGVNHYFFNVTNNSGSTTFTATATLVWNRQQNQSAINNLNLFLYNCANSNLVNCSTSLVDNVEHIYMTNFPAGRYDLQVWKAGGANIVSTSETYALAWEFFSQTLNMKKSGTNLILNWPVYPDGFVVESATNLISPNWNTNNLPPPVFTNNQNVILVNATNAAQFFRLRRPDF